MWCRHCHQETPAIGPVTEFGARCPRCNRTSDTPTDPINTAGESAPDPLPTARREIERQLQSAQNAIAAGAASPTLRWDTGMLGSPIPFSQEKSPSSQSSEAAQQQPTATKNQPTNRKIIRRANQPKKKSYVISQIVGWASATVGAMSLGLGIGLLVWSLIQENASLWSFGIAATITGQSLMIVGLVQLLSNLWNATRQTHTKLTQIHEDLHRVRRTAEQTAGQQHATATGFYAEMAANAEPDVLLGNLRGQLDQLSARLRFDR